MFFESVSDFLNMGGYGFYVWLSYGLSFLALAGLIVQGMLRKKTLIKEIQREQQRVKYQSSQGESL
ncbi:heme exporter protein CcmD [Avibacterium paragallinarum]|uniref:Heme exporter protein D n=1 Tax=Avibacterium paragallinarum TaxID=728 RepID=A0A0F5EXF0_AVIPA|nr:heme exporter protein CcmD [Avibacterium paragallinarum]KAA6209524.1 heme exporter protein CcmD [Avibacterium paragallinarum]KKB01309.1 hemagglutination activity protein [Avibacterium paragallinarum]MEE3607612.1 heme exporter protein CcmD [Avibacterium paragallinarum]MEE3620012.1 heme exporter protein CcmD [Avibacterium paragallinarum]MEE3667696.1 heme exporter protein CcmD [Avibacterium paragallinarum]